MKSLYTIITILISVTSMQAQIYTDYIGAGHSDGILVTTSDNTSSATEGINTLNGSGMDNAYMEAARFLAQATLGFDETDVQNVMNLGIEGWIDIQFVEDIEHVVPNVHYYWQEQKNALGANGIDTANIFGPAMPQYSFATTNIVMDGRDQLRHRVANALSEILVVSSNSDLGGDAVWLGDYHDILLDHSYGNYKDLLLEVTKSTQMGYYLSHFNNPKTDTLANIRPDENYAREIMQLFTIGLFELNLDGTLKRDADGNPLPTYDNEDIKELAKVFTGLGIGRVIDTTMWPFYPRFGVNLYNVDRQHPMAMFNHEHEPGPKVLLKDITLNIPGDGMAEIDFAVDYLFNHPNVGPFIGYRLIQRMVKSNPSPAYVSRVAAAFNDNGQGVRGDMKAVIKAILLDEEARNGEYMKDEAAGYVRNPYLRVMHMLTSLDIESTGDFHWDPGYQTRLDLKHFPLSAPSVFNFYLPDFSPVGEITDKGYVSPELKIHNTSTSINYINRMHAATRWDAPYWDFWWNGVIYDTTSINTDYYWSIAHDPELIINDLDRKLTFGQLTEETRSIIRTAADSIYWTWDENWRWDRTRVIMLLFLMSPDYAVLR